MTAPLRDWWNPCNLQTLAPKKFLYWLNPFTCILVRELKALKFKVLPSWTLSTFVSLILRGSYKMMEKTFLQYLDDKYWNEFISSLHSKLLSSLPMYLFSLLPPGSLTNNYCWLIWSSFWTHRTIVDQFIFKGAHQSSCRKKMRVSKNFA